MYRLKHHITNINNLIHHEFGLEMGSNVKIKCLETFAIGALNSEAALVWPRPYFTSVGGRLWPEKGLNDPAGLKGLVEPPV